MSRGLGDVYKRQESPVGKALIGAHKDDIVDVETPAGIMQYKVLSIQRNI